MRKAAAPASSPPALALAPDVRGRRALSRAPSLKRADFAGGCVDALGVSRPASLPAARSRHLVVHRRLPTTPVRPGPTSGAVGSADHLLHRVRAPGKARRSASPLPDAAPLKEHQAPSRTATRSRALSAFFCAMGLAPSSRLTKSRSGCGTLLREAARQLARPCGLPARISIRT